MANIPVSIAIDNLLKSTTTTTVTTAQALTALGAVTTSGALGTPTSGTLTNATGLPIDAGTIGTLPVNRGGTGAATAATARTNILPAYAGNAGKVLAVNATATEVEYIAAGGAVGFSAITGQPTDNGNLTTALNLKTNNSVGFMEDFTNSTRWDELEEITNNTTLPLIGTYPYWLGVAGVASPAPSVQNRGYGAGANNQLWYLGNNVPTSGGKMSLGFKFELRRNPTSLSGFNNSFNISFNREEMMTPSTGSILPDGVVHMNFNRLGIASVDIYNGNAATNTIITNAVRNGNVVTLTTQANHIFVHPAKITVAGITGSGGTSPNGDFTTTSASGNTITYTLTGSPTGTYGFAGATVIPPVFTCLSHVSANGVFPFTKQTNGGLPLDRDFSILIKVDGEYMTITVPTIGSFLFHSTVLPTKIGSAGTYFWFEDTRGDSYTSWGFIKKIWGGNNSILDTDPDWGGFIGGNLTSLNTSTFHVLPGTVISNAANPSTLSGNGLVMVGTLPAVDYGFKAAATSATDNLKDGELVVGRTYTVRTAQTASTLPTAAQWLTMGYVARVPLSISTSAARSGDTVTLTTASAHGLTGTPTIFVSGITGSTGTSPNGLFTATSASGSTIVYTVTGAGGTYVYAGATVATRTIPIVGDTFTALTTGVGTNSGCAISSPTTTTALARANGGNVFIEGGYLSNVGFTNSGGQINGRAPMVLASEITTTQSSTTGTNALLKLFTRIPSLVNSDSQSIEIYGQLVGVLAKRINIVLDSSVGTLFDSDLISTPLNSISGAYRIVIKRFSLSGAGSIFYTVMTLPDGTNLPMSRLPTNMTTENINIRFQTTTAAAGGVTIDGAIQTVEKVISR